MEETKEGRYYAYIINGGKRQVIVGKYIFINKRYEGFDDIKNKHPDDRVYLTNKKNTIHVSISEVVASRKKYPDDVVSVAVSLIYEYDKNKKVQHET